MILFIIQTEHSLRQPMFYFLTMLAFTDLSLSTATICKMLGIFWFNFREMLFSACLAEMFMIHLYTGLESGVLIVMAIDCYVAIHIPLRLTMILTNKVMAILGVVMTVISLTFCYPFLFLILPLSFCGARMVSHTYCEHMGVTRLSCTSTRANNLLGMVALSMGFTDLIVIGFSCVRILCTVFHLPSRNARVKALSTHGSHVCVVLSIYILALSPFLTHHFGHGIPGYTHIFLANIYMVFPPALNAVNYEVRTKQIYTHTHRYV